MSASWRQPETVASRKSIVPEEGKGGSLRWAPGLEHTAGELGAGFHAELPEHLVEVVFHSARADEELGGDFGVRPTLGHELGDPGLLGREIVARPGGALASVPPGGAQLDAGSLGEALHTEFGEQPVGDLQLLTGVHVPALAAQPFAVEEMGAGAVKAQDSGRQPV